MYSLLLGGAVDHDGGKEQKLKKTYQAAAVAHHPRFRISAIVGWQGQRKEE